MTKRKTNLSVFAMILAMVSTGLFMPRLMGAGDMEPSDSPGSTMKTLDEIPPTWSQKLQCDETACPRFELVMDGYAVLDKETGLVWAKEANLFVNTLIWYEAMIQCRDVGIGGRKGWRLPTVEELASLLDPQQSGFPYLPSGHPFENVQQAPYWTATTYYSFTDIVGYYAYYVNMSSGGVAEGGKDTWFFTWPVRGGS